MKNEKIYEQCYQGSIRETVADFIDNSPLLFKFTGKEYYELEDSLVDLIQTVSKKHSADISDNQKIQSTMYLIIFDWSTDDDNGIETYLYYDHDAAYKKFNEIVNDELDPEMSWVGSRAINKNKKAKKGYVLNYKDEMKGDNKTCFYVMEEGNYNFHSCIDLIKKEIDL